MRYIIHENTFILKRGRTFYKNGEKKSQKKLNIGEEPSGNVVLEDPVRNIFNVHFNYHKGQPIFSDNITKLREDHVMQRTLIIRFIYQENFIVNKFFDVNLNQIQYRIRSGQVVFDIADPSTSKG